MPTSSTLMPALRHAALPAARAAGVGPAPFDIGSRPWDSKPPAS